jgi:hypothetical protein
VRVWRRRVEVELKLPIPKPQRMMKLLLPPFPNWSQTGFALTHGTSNKATSGIGLLRWCRGPELYVTSRRENSLSPLGGPHAKPGCKAKGATLTVLAFRPDVTIHHFHKAFRDREAESCTAVLSSSPKCSHPLFRNAKRPKVGMARENKAGCQSCIAKERRT